MGKSLFLTEGKKFGMTFHFPKVDHLFEKKVSQSGHDDKCELFRPRRQILDLIT